MKDIKSITIHLLRAPIKKQHVKCHKRVSANFFCCSFSHIFLQTNYAHTGGRGRHG